jgi:drug/metabolite transporter (DMT)-like permease
VHDRRADGALVAAAFFFGSTFLVVKEAVERADPLPFLAVRFVIGALALWPLARRRAATEGEWRDGAIAGVALLGGYVFQTVGLQYTSSATSAFITYLLVVFVPLLSAVVLRWWPHPLSVAGVAIAVAGLWLLTSARTDGFGRGEALTLGCAVAFAIHIVVLGRVAVRHDPIRLTLVQLLVVAAGCAVPGAFAGSFRLPAVAVAGALATGIGATAAAFVLQVWAQRLVTPTRAAILLLLEPVFAGSLGTVAGDRLGAKGWAGAGLITAAIVVGEVLPQLRGRR